MSTLAEIESAAAQLSPAEQDVLLQHLGAMVRRRHAPEVSEVRRRLWMDALAELRASTATGKPSTSEQILDQLREERI